MIKFPHITDKKELADWLIANKSALIAQKKSELKRADAFSFVTESINEKGEVTKADGAISADATKIKVRCIINTTKLLDSHGDVHIDQLWNKSLKETKDHYLVKEHDFSFEGIISDNVKAFAKQMLWKDLGFDYEGYTQALIFDCVIDKSESPIMFEKYRMGKVKQHSVGMRYVNVKLAINDDRYQEEKGNWDKYITEVANKSDAEALGYFWPVLEAKIIEGSAVVRGSNFATPTHSIQQVKSEADVITPENENKNEPSADTQKLNYNFLLNNLKL
jgi:hypothetical protein